jgi:sugar phosphate isomerase/epimerase
LRISLSTASLYFYPLRHTFALAKHAGFEGLEVALSLEVLARGGAYVRKLSQEYSLPVFSLHPPMVPWPRKKEHHKLLPQLTSVARELGCQLMIIHAPKALTLTEGVGAEYTDAVRACVEDLRGSSLRLCVENQAVFRPSDRRYVLSTTGNLRQFTEEYDLSVTLDTAHAASYPYGLIEAYETLESRLVNIHLSDFRQDLSIPPWFNLHSYFKHHQVPGDADLPLVPFLERLRADSYEGLITVEVSPFAMEAWRPQRVRENLKRCLEFVQRPFLPLERVEDRKRARRA